MYILELRIASEVERQLLLIFVKNSYIHGLKLPYSFLHNIPVTHLHQAANSIDTVQRRHFLSSLPPQTL
jgi:hypothetical protein